ncbi:substrate-binding periplasmic protein [Kiloniella majae]|uniref:substrate-binding periplasmic protein n=1 Tax=Kiloniella majae TaxID=1938558 RepID=UPI0013029E93|nr:transporter substrate-binding domain-containing protein [Kiloniella majae]
MAFATSLQVSVFDLPPFGGRDASGKIVGIIPEILTEIEKETGHNIQMKIVPYKRMFFDLENGTSDFAIFFRSSKSEKIAIPKVRIYTLKNIVVGMKGINLNEYRDLSERLISVTHGTYYLDKFDNDSSLKKIFVRRFSNAIQQLIAGRTDLVVGPELSIAHHMKKNASSSEALGKPLFLSYASAWLQVSEKMKNNAPEIVDQLVYGVGRLHDKDVIPRILEEYK